MSIPNFGVKIESDFVDFYDNLSASEDVMAVYKRNYKDCSSRASDLRFLRDIGIKTVELKAAREFDNSFKKLVVYTDPKMHQAKGKIILSLDEARDLYGNQPATPFYECAEGLTVKYLQVGTLRYRIYMQARNANILGNDAITFIEQLTPDFNYAIMQPLFSIDYITNGKEMLAIDYNRVQCLSSLGFEKVLTSEDIMIQIKKALIAYNKIQ